MRQAMSDEQLSMNYTEFLPDTPQSESIKWLAKPRYLRFEEAQRRIQALFESRRYPVSKREKDEIMASLGITLRISDHVKKTRNRGGES